MALFLNPDHLMRSPEALSGFPFKAFKGCLLCLVFVIRFSQVLDLLSGLRLFSVQVHWLSCSFVRNGLV